MARKAIIFTALTVFILTTACVYVSQFKYYRPKFVFDYKVQVPKDFVPPEYVKRLVYAKSEITRLIDGSMIVNDYYEDPAFVYMDQFGAEWPPYLEVLKISKDPSELPHLVSLKFVNDEGKVVFYDDKEFLLGNPPADKLGKVFIKEESILKKVPRKPEQKLQREKSKEEIIKEFF